MQLSAFITNDAVVLGLLFIILGAVFFTSGSTKSGWVRFYKVVPTILLCYFLPSLLNSFGIVDGEASQLYPVMSRYLLPVSLVLLTLSIDFKALSKLGGKAVIMFLAGSVGVMLGGPLAILLCKHLVPGLFEAAGPDAPWRGMSTIAGSWIGGSANQAAMKELFGVSDKLFGTMITLDVIISYVWMAFLLYGAGKSASLDAKLKANSSAINDLKEKLNAFQRSVRRIPTTADVVLICAVGFGATAIGHFGADVIAPYVKTHAPHLERFSLTSSFFWLVIITTTIGMALAATPLRRLEGAGASTMGTVLLYLLIATLGMKMDITAIFDTPALMLVCTVWLLFHILLMFLVAKLIKAPFFFIAVGSMANIGGPASAPVVAAAFSPALAPVGVVLAVLGYAIGTYAAYICGLLMQWASG
ncbi:MAG: DUF819 family protein [Bacteroidetes bacterium]|nr:MAG: DUF819 family protein [Bacteroidota bacterium]